MTELDDLPQMVSLSPEPTTSLDNTSLFTKKTTENLSELRRHNWDAEVIEILWKQDCDLGLTRSDFAPVLPVQEDAVPEKLARLGQEWCPESCKLEVPSAEAPEDSLEDIWAGLDYTVDSETGEYVLRMPPAGAADAAPTVPSSVENLNATGDPLMAAPIPTTIADLVTTDQPATAPTAQESVSRARRLTRSSDSGRESLDDSDSGDVEIDRLNEMIDAARNQTGAAQPLQRMVSIEERWQDLASILRLSEQPGPAAAVAAAAAAAAVQTPRPLFTAHSPSQSRYPADSVAPPQLCSPVAPSPAAAEACLPSPPESEQQYYQLAPMVAPPAAAEPSPLDQESTFLSQLLGVDDLDIVAESVAPEFWMPSQSAPSALATVENTSSSAPQLQELGPLAAANTASGSPSAPEGGPHRRQPPAAQKKHQMFGKRMFNGQQQEDYESRSPGGSSSGSGEQQPTAASPVRQRYGSEAGVHGAYPGAHVPAPGEAAALASPAEPKYSGTAEFAAATAQHRLSPVAHNHSYQQPSPAEGISDTRRPVARDKAQRLSRDERRTREMNIPMTPDEIVHLPMDEFNERLSKMQLTEAQLSLVRDVRRRGKNKMAAQNCRKRKLDQIQTLADTLQKVRDQRRRDLADNQRLASERARIRDKYTQLHRHVFQSLRDEEGRPYSASQYSLQLSADGDVLLVPRGTARGAAFVPPDPSTGARRKQQCE